MKGSDLLKHGIVGRIGTGDNVRIWDDPWLPRGITRRPRTNRTGVLLDRVSEMMNPVTENWDEELVLDLFCPEDARDILAIPVQSGMEDQPAWHFDPRGIF